MMGLTLQVLEPVIKTLCYNFVTDRCSGEAMAAGLNTIREISVRAPHVMTEELLRDLAQYKTHKDKSIQAHLSPTMECY